MLSLSPSWKKILKQLWLEFRLQFLLNLFPLQGLQESWDVLDEQHHEVGTNFLGSKRWYANGYLYELVEVVGD